MIARRVIQAMGLIASGVAIGASLTVGLKGVDPSVIPILRFAGFVSGFGGAMYFWRFSE